MHDCWGFCLDSALIGASRGVGSRNSGSGGNKWGRAVPNPGGASRSKGMSGDDAGMAGRSTGRHVSQFQSGVMPPHSTGESGAAGREFSRDGEFTM